MYQPTDHGYATIDPSMQITGTTDGMNEKGLAMGYNFINRVGRADGFSCNMIGRLILETCANVEASPRKIIARKSNVSTNHIEVLTEENRYRTDESVRKQKEIETQNESELDGYNAYRILNDKDRNVFLKNMMHLLERFTRLLIFQKKEKRYLELVGIRWQLSLILTVI